VTRLDHAAYLGRELARAEVNKALPKRALSVFRFFESALGYFRTAAYHRAGKLKLAVPTII
jgi:hypothetical protein